MESNLKKKMGLAAAVSLVAFTGILNAADDAQMRNLENRVNALEQRKGASGMINPPARPVVKEGVDMFVTGELLVWKATQDDMAYAVQLDQNPTINGFNSGKVKNWRGKWAAGFRVGLGYNMAHDGWDIDAYWTHFNMHGKSEEDDNECECVAIFQPVFQPKDFNNGNTTAVFVLEAEARKWKLDINMVDLEMGREFFVSKWLTLRPFVGLRGAWVRQKFEVEYAGNGTFASNYTTLLAGANSVDFESMKTHMWGVGPRAGLNTQWGVGSGVSFYGNLALSTVWGRTKVTEVANAQNEVAATEAEIEHFSNKFSATRAILDLALGLRYDTTFADDSWAWGIWAGWESHYFWSQNKLFNFGGHSNGEFYQYDGDLATNGVTIGMSFDF